MDSHIKLSLCGRIFEVERSILLESELFRNMLTDCPTDNSVIRINRSARIFEHVLAYLIDRSYPYPKKYESELQYYLVPYKSFGLYDSNFVIKDLRDEVRSLRCRMENSTDTVCCHYGCYENIIHNPVTCLKHLGRCSYTDEEHERGQGLRYIECYNECASNEKYCSEHSFAYEWD